MKKNENYSHGNWHGKHCYFGFHHDLHADLTDTVLGTRCEDLANMLRLAGVEFVQTDSKGHPGYTTWESLTPDASIAPGLVQDALAQWRAATRMLGLPLHAHYSGIWDQAAGAKHPDWCLLTADGSPATAPYTIPGWPTNATALMCPRSPYADELMIPQMLEMIDRYEIDGFWVDGDIWAMQPCYCPRCRQAYTAETGEIDPPVNTDDPRWAYWWNFTKRSLEKYLTKYCDAVHAHKPGVLVCSNWLQTLHNPGEPVVPTDWISADNTPVWGLDGSRCQARFVSTRGKPWDIMLWDFYASHGIVNSSSPWVTKPVQMLMQEAAVVLAFGGNIQACDAPWSPCGLRTGQHVPWRMKRIGKMGKFVKARRSLCQDTTTIPQIAVLLSENHAYSTITGHNLMWDVNTNTVEGAVLSLLENQYGVDILDEWALLQRISEFPVVVVPEQHKMSDTMVETLKKYVAEGGKLLLSGAAIFNRFGSDFLGVTDGEIVRNATYHLPADDGAVALYSDNWRLVELTGASALLTIGTTPLLDEYLLPNPGATIHRYGKGKVLYVPADIFRDFAHNRYPLTRVLIGKLLQQLAGKMDITVKCPTCVDIALRRQGNKQIIHLINRASGLPNVPNSGAIDEIPPVGPITITINRKTPPTKVQQAFESANLQWTYTPRKNNTLKITLSQVHIHTAIVVTG